MPLAEKWRRDAPLFIFCMARRTVYGAKDATPFKQLFYINPSILD